MSDYDDSHPTVYGLAAGRQVFQRFTLTRELGRGGMGVVWQARDEKLERDVALKFLPASVSGDPEAISDLKRETRRALALTHARIVRIFDFLEDERHAAISMELVDGSSLAVRKLAQPDRHFEVAALEPLVRQLCEALDYAHHEAKVVHRDLKPANVMVTTGGELKVTDFGIAATLTDTYSRTQKATGATSGTAAYMSPQQMCGRKPAVTDDVYALGAMLYELLTSKPPFHTGRIEMQVMDVRPPSMGERRTELEISGAPIPRVWEETIAACLAKKPEARPQAAGDVWRRLQGGGSDAAPTAKIKLTDTAAARRPRRFGLVAGVGVAAALALLAYAFWPKTAEHTEPAKPGPASVVKADEKNADLPDAPTAAQSREFAITVDPSDAGARVWIGPVSDLAVPDGGPLLVRNLPDGEHELIVQAPGFQPLTTRVTVKDGRGAAVAKLVPVRGALSFNARRGTVVTAVDSRGRVTQIGTVYGPGMFISDDLLSVGTYTVKFAHPDLEPAELPVELVLGRTVHLTPPQKPLPGELRVFSVPTGAEVSINGKRAGTTPATLPAQPSEVALNVEVFARGYRRSAQSVTLKPREVRTLNVGTLAAESGAVSFRFSNLDPQSVRPEAKIDGRVVDASRPLEGLEVGTRAVEITHPDYEPWRQEIAVRDQQVTPVEVKLAPRPGRLVLRANVKEFSLTLNGRALRADEVRDGVLLLPASEAHTIVVSAKGHKSASRTLTMTANGSDAWEVALEKLLGPEPGQAWTIPDLGLTLMPIAAGTFMMGSENGDANEKPVTWVTISQPYWLGKTEVTQAQWTVVMGNNPANFKGESRPVEQVSWDDAMAFCRKVTERERAAGRLPEGYAYTLPTEAQWEYACRAGTTGDYASNLDAMGWYSPYSGGQTHPVGQKQANAWGLHDMHGNVWEWCRDWYADHLSGGSVTDPIGASSGFIRVERGGGWGGSARNCRSAGRNGWGPGNRVHALGFRLSLSSTGLAETTTAPTTPGPQFSNLSQVTADQNTTSRAQPPAPARLGAGMKDLFDSAELDQKPVARVMAPPAYPFEMRRAGISGEVVVEFIIDTRGDVILAQVTRSSRREFEAAAILTVQKWKFKPGRKDGRVVNTRALTPVVFSLAE